MTQDIRGEEIHPPLLRLGLESVKDIGNLPVGAGAANTEARFLGRESINYWRDSSKRG
jgi:hypothetical protein